MTELRKAAEKALEALDQLTDDVDGTGLSSKPSFDSSLDAITALRAALTQPEQGLQLVANLLKEYGLEALEVIAVLKTQPEQEPVAWLQTENFIDPEGLWDERKTFNCEGDGTPLYTAPLQRKPLTEEEIGKATAHIAGMHCAIVDEIARAIEKAHGIK